MGGEESALEPDTSAAWEGGVGPRQVVGAEGGEWVLRVWVTHWP